MKAKSVMKNRNTRFAVLVALAFCVLSSIAQAVSPAPDGGYPGGNTAEGTSALFSLTSGIDNTALGFQALYHNTTGNANSAEGFRALFSNTTGFQNTASGAHALQNNTRGAQNTADGLNALFHNTTGYSNTAVGAAALLSNIDGVNNTAVGSSALKANVGDQNTGQGINNTATGASALSNNTTGNSNTAVGAVALLTNNADDNSAFGSYALFANTDGSINSAFGWDALALNTQGGGNTAIGAQALLRNVTGIGNTATGRAALSFSTGDLNTAIGYTAGTNVATASNVICIGAQVAGADVNDSCFIGNIWAQAGGPQAVYVNIDGKLGAQVSSRRFKDDVKPMDTASRALYSLKPVTFHYKKEIDPAGASQFGLVAEEVEKVNPDLVVRDKHNKPFSVRYDQVNAMLLNEFLKEHGKVDKLEATVAEQQKGMQNLAAQIKEQDSKLQRVISQVGLGDAASKIAVSAP